MTGTEHDVKYNTDNMRKWVENGNDNLVLIHNHPSNRIFSDRDIFNFCKTKAVNIMIVVGNRGNIYCLQKQHKFDKFKMMECYSNVTEMYRYRWPREKILDYVLQQYQQLLSIQYAKAEI